MSVLVKGMKIPTICPKCIFADDENSFCRVANKYYCWDGKPKWCPLVEVPTPHGRLIDADELQKKFDLAQKSLEQHGQEFSDAFMSTSQEISTEWWAVEQKLEDAKTVIESEE